MSEKKYTAPTPIQVKAIPFVREGKDLLGCAQTGTGKTAAFALPILQRLQDAPGKGPGRRPIRTLVLTPTRELASQIAESFGGYGRHTGMQHAIVFGGVNQGPGARPKRLTGWPIMEAAGKPLAEVFCIINARTREPATDPVGRVLETGEELKPANDTALLSRDGSERQIAHSAAPIRAEEGNISGVVLVFSDVTIRNQAEKALRESEASLQAILRSTADGILAVSSENRVLFANERFVEMWMIPQEVMDSEDDHALLQTVLGQLTDPESFLEKVQRLYKSQT